MQRMIGIKQKGESEDEEKSNTGVSNPKPNVGDLCGFTTNLGFRVITGCIICLFSFRIFSFLLLHFCLIHKMDLNPKHSQ